MAEITEMQAEDSILSGRELEVLQLVARGMTNREIAQALTISPNTVKVHLSNIFEKISVSSRTEATLYGIEHGLVDVPGGETASTPAQEDLFVQLRKYRWIGVGLALLLILFLLMLSTNVLSPSSGPEQEALAELAERWQELASMPEPRAAMAAGAYDGKIYAFAGEGPEGVSGSVFRYDPESDDWSQLSDKPTAVADVEAALIGEKFYIPGGRLENGLPTDILEIYDPRTDTWEVGAPLPHAISSYALVGFEGQVYLFGGWDGEKAIDMVYVFDPGEGVWREGTAMGTARYDHGAVGLTDKIVVLGGRDGEVAFKDAEAYFPSRDAAGEAPWEDFLDLPDARYGFGVASISETIYVIGDILQGNAEEESVGLFWSDVGWIPFSTNQLYTDNQKTVVPIGSSLIVFDPAGRMSLTKIWGYQALYYTIYLPFMP